MAAIHRSLGHLGTRAELEIRAARGLPCVRAEFHIVQDAYEIFVYTNEVAVRIQGQKYVFTFRDFGHEDRELARALGEFLQLCGSGLAPGVAAAEILLPRRRRHRPRENGWVEEER